MKRDDGVTARDSCLRPQTVNERVKVWFKKAGLVGDGRPVSSQGLRAGAATGLGEDGADQELEEPSRWKKGSYIPRERYVRPAKKAAYAPFKKVPVHAPEAAAAEEAEADI
ncbi:hypothetical protein [Streptomyces fractus]|uniref:hypothetical protein n=1 Tax=Streptomyces fractus TaxID=641806 RepID=UPI003CEEF287